MGKGKKYFIVAGLFLVVSGALFTQHLAGQAKDDAETTFGFGSFNKTLIDGFHRMEKGKGGKQGLKNKSDPCLLIGIAYSDELTRQTLRETWLKWATGSCVEYRFVVDLSRKGTDDSNNEDQTNTKEQLANENEKYKDLFIVHGSSNKKWSSSKLMMNFFVYAESSIKYDYFAMVNAHSFVCLKRLMNELKYIRKPFFVNGVLPCTSSTMVAYEDDLLYMSRDVIKLLLLRDDILGLIPKCLFGQSLSIWLSGTLANYYHETRIIPLKKDLSQDKNICTSGLSLTRLQASHIKEIWEYEVMTPSKQIDEVAYSPKESTLHCPYPLSLSRKNCISG